MIKALIFDFNGVLVDDEAVHFELFREVLEREGVVITERDYHERYLGYDDRGCFAAALGDAGLAYDEQRLDDLIVLKAHRYAEVAENGLRYFPFAAETLANLAKHWPVAICSGALRSEIEYALKRLDRRDHVVAIIAAEDAHKCKPDPAGYLQALGTLRGYLRAGTRTSANAGSVFAPDLQARDCLVIEDSLAGILSAKGAGMQAVGISHTYNAVQLRKSGADAVIDGLETLTPEWIKQQF
jgi:beta-phosphoglucomutase